MKISKQEYLKADAKLEDLLNLVNQKGGFEFLENSEKEDLEKQTEIVRLFEAQSVHISMPDTLQNILELKMFENKLKQKDLAKLLETTDTQLSEILHSKRKPTITFLKNLNQKLGVDGNLLLNVV